MKNLPRHIVSLLRLPLSALLSIALAIPALADSSPVSVAIEIQADEPGATINPNIYGQFAEHLGRGIYEGVWVGEDSSIPNTNGFRNDVIAALKKMQVPLIRWPGGCFADEYHWRDGIGPRDQRPVKVNTHWGGVEETNAFGTHEFFQLAEMLDAETYINGNLGTGTPREMAEWLEYMTSDTTSTLANLRRKNGREEPWDVDYFGIGNEAWGCGGNMRPEYYVDLYRRYATFLKAPKGHEPKFIASGGTGDDTEWTQVLSSNIDRNMDAISFHYYTLPTGEWDEKGKSTGFGEDQWISTMAQTLRIEKFIENNVAILEENDPDNDIGFYVDEWGTWYDPEPGREPGFLYQQNTIRDAVVAAANLNIFHAHADRVHMTNIAQMVNVLQAMILTDKEKMLLTPTYHVFEMYVPFQNATLLPVDFDKSAKYEFGDYAVPAVSASAARGEDGKLYLALANLNPNRAARVSTSVDGDEVTTAKGRVLTADAMDAHNTFAKPETVKPVAYTATSEDGKLVLDVPAKSVVVVVIE